MNDLHFAERSIVFFDYGVMLWGKFEWKMFPARSPFIVVESDFGVKRRLFLTSAGLYSNVRRSFE